MQDMRIAQWRDAIRAHTFGNYHMEMGLAVREQSPAAAAAHFSSAVSVQPDDPMSHALLVESLTSCGKLAEARTADEAAKKINTKYNSVAYSLLALKTLHPVEKWTANLEKLESYIAQIEADDPGNLKKVVSFALTCLTEDNPANLQLAESDVDPAILHPLHETLMEIAHYRYQHGDYAPALAASSLAISLVDAIPDCGTWTLVARSQKALGKTGDAIRSYEKAIGQNSVDTSLHLELASLLENDADRIARIDSLLTQALQIKPDQSSKQALGQFLLWRGEFELLESLLPEWKLDNPNDPVVTNLTSLDHLASGRYLEAEALGRSAREGNQTSPLLEIYTAFALTGLSRHDEAIRIARNQAKPEDSWSRACLGRILLSAGDIQAAEIEIEQAVKLAPKNSWTLSAKALLKLRTGNNAEFKTLLQMSTQAQPLRVWFRSRLLPTFTAELDAGYLDIGFTQTAWWPDNSRSS